MFRKSILAGVCIAIGALIYIKFPTPVGAAFFSAGLLLIMTLDYRLYTGVIGLAQTPQDFGYAGLILLGNSIGAMVALLANPTAAQDIVAAKLASTTTLATFIKACLCGGIIYGCVAAHKIKNDLLVILFVAAFILCGAEHSIADICYFAAARAPLIPSAIYTLIVVLGNAVGAQVFRRVHLIGKGF